MCVQNVMTVHPIFVEIFQSQPTVLDKLSDWDYHPTSLAATMGNNQKFQLTSVQPIWVLTQYYNNY